MPRKKRSPKSKKSPGKSTSPPSLNDALEREAKSIVSFAFRNGPLEDLHAGKACPNCDGKKAYSKISNPEMKVLMKTAVNSVYSLLKLKNEQPDVFEGLLTLGDSYTYNWDPAEFTARI